MRKGGSLRVRGVPEKKKGERGKRGQRPRHGLYFFFFSLTLPLATSAVMTLSAVWASCVFGHEIVCMCACERSAVRVQGCGAGWGACKKGGVGSARKTTH